MKHKTVTTLASIACCSIVASVPVITLATQFLPVSEQKARGEYHYFSQQELVNFLDWVPGKNDPCDLCDGHYKQPPAILKVKHPKPAKQLPTTITAKGPAILAKQGYTILKDDVVITQQGRRVTADKAFFFRNAKTGKITLIKLFGHVRMQEFGRLVYAKKAIFNLKNNSATFYYSAYHVNERTLTQDTSLNTKNKKLKYDAWGVAKIAKQIKKGVLEFWGATYSTCPPIQPAWRLITSYLKLNRNKDVGVAHNVVIKFMNVPIFYTPYMTFPLTNRRKSGFLMPLTATTNSRGFQIGVPYYWNIAPNYDMTIDPIFMTKRGFELNLLFRYMTNHNQGQLYFSFLPYDNAFRLFRKNTIAQFPNPTPAQAPFINELRKASNTRGYISYQDNGTYGKHWSSLLQINYVSDPYFFNDLGTTQLVSFADQLLNQLVITFKSKHWTIHGLIQAYQTLHPFQLQDYPSINQYTRLPEFDFDGFYPAILWNIDAGLKAQVVNFLYHSDFAPFTYQRPIGQRIHIRPYIKREFNFGAGYITPMLSLDAVQYYAKQAVTAANIARPYFEGGRSLPIFDIDAGLYFDRTIHAFHHAYIQTLEPRIFYLYVPFMNQNQFPMFDTQLLPFTFNQLFALNRFSGFDRLENANQISIALTSRILDAKDSDPKLFMGVGFIYYFAQPRVSYTNPFNPAQTITPRFGQTSPIVGQITWYPWIDWSVSGNIAWDPNNNSLNNSNFSITYNNTHNLIASFGYSYVEGVNIYTLNPLGLDGTTASVHAGVSLPITHRWSILGYLNYDLSRKFTQTEFAGVQYSTCCWAIRVLAARRNTGVATNSTAGNVRYTFDQGVYVQLLLKGLTSVGNNQASSLVQSGIPGFKDIFSVN